MVGSNNPVINRDIMFGNEAYFIDIGFDIDAFDTDIFIRISVISHFFIRWMYMVSVLTFFHPQTCKVLIMSYAGTGF